jgi:hypothetical protein
MASAYNLDGTPPPSPPPPPSMKKRRIKKKETETTAATPIAVGAPGPSAASTAAFTRC